MRFYILTLALIPLLIAALPVPQDPTNATADAANALVNGIQANLDAGQGEEQTVKTLQSLEQNGASASDIAAGIANVKAALDQAISDRVSNQALAADFPNVLAGLAKVETAQTSATAMIGALNCEEANDAPILSTLLTTFEKGFATNQANLALVSFRYIWYAFQIVLILQS
jgi:hypothetical protein